MWLALMVLDPSVTSQTKEKISIDSQQFISYSYLNSYVFLVYINISFGSCGIHPTKAPSWGIIFYHNRTLLPAVQGDTGGSGPKMNTLTIIV